MVDGVKINGKVIAEKLRNNITNTVREIKNSHNLTPGLAVVLVGNDPASEIYVRNKETMIADAGMKSFEHKLPSDTTQKELLTLIDGLNSDPAVHGILVQLPLPNHIEEHKIIAEIDYEKDVDGFHVFNAGRLATGVSGLVPCTPLGCLILIKEQLGDNLRGKKAVILGRSNIVGKPMAALLLREHCTVTITHSQTLNLATECKEADILVVAVGKPKMVKKEWVKTGAVVIDVGINRLPPDKTGNSKLVGDVDYNSVIDIAGAITPVPGGVGPMTIACLLQNTVMAACKQNGVDIPN